MSLNIRVESKLRKLLKLMCSHSLRPLGLPIYVARVPAPPFSLLPLSLYFDHSHCPRACASYPSCVAVYPRDSRSRRVVCRSSHSRGAFAKIRLGAKLGYELKTLFHQQVVSDPCFRLRHLCHCHADAGAREPHRCSAARAKSSELRN